MVAALSLEEGIGWIGPVLQSILKVGGVAAGEGIPCLSKGSVPGTPLVLSGSLGGCGLHSDTDDRN